MPYKIHPSRRTWTLEETKIPQRAWTLEGTQIPHRPNSTRRAPPRRDIRGAVLVNPSFQRSNEPVLEENMEPQMMEAPMPRAPSGHHRVAIKRENINLVRECEWDVKSLKDDNDGRIKTTLSKPLTLILGFVCLTSLASLLLTLLVVFGSVGTRNCPCARNKVAGSTGAMKSVDEERIVDVSGKLTSLDKKLEGKILEVEQRYEFKVKELLDKLSELRLTIQQQKINAEKKELSQDKQVKNLTERLASTRLELESLKAQLSWHVTRLWNTTNSTRTQLNHLEGVWIIVNASSARISNLTKKTDDGFERVSRNMNASNETLNELLLCLQALKLQIKNESETVWFRFNQSTKSFVTLKSSLQSLKENVAYRSQKLESRIKMEEQKSNDTSYLTQQHHTKLQNLKEMLNSTRQAAKEASFRHLTALWSAGNNTKKELYKVWTAVNKSQTELEEKLLKTKHNFTEELRQAKAVLESSDATLFASLTNVNASLAEKVKNVSKMAGPIGPPGFNGSRGPPGQAGSRGEQGPKGAGDFSACHYKRDQEANTPGSNR
ncbi:hypothetical protein ABFA07_007604 [Porites harrisoni]